MNNLKKGCFCISKAGHDKGSVYVIIETGAQVKLSDGKFKKLDNPKIKNFRHLEVLNYEDELLLSKLADGKLQNEDIKYSIKKYLNHIKFEGGK